MEPTVSNPFSTTPGVEDDDVMTPGARSLVRNMQRADYVKPHDPLADAEKVLTQRKTQIGYAKNAVEQLESKFIDGKGAGLFVKDLTTGKPMRNADKTYQMDTSGIDTLRENSGKTVGAIRGMFPGANAGDPTDEAKAAAAELAQKEPVHKALMDEWNRIQMLRKRAEDAHNETELKLGGLATQRLEQQGIFGELPAEQPISQQDSSAAEQRGHIPRVDGSNPSPAPSLPINNAQADAPAAPIATQPAANPKNFMPLPGERDPAEYQAPTPGTGPTPNQLVQLHKRMKDADEMIKSENISEKMAAGILQKQSRQMAIFENGMKALPEALQKRVLDATRDPTFTEYGKNFFSRAGEGIGSTITDMGESALRNAKYAPNVILPGITAFTPDVVRKQQEQGDAIVKEFATAMRDEASGWGLKGVPAEVAKQLNDSFSGSVGQGIGSTIGFIGPTSIVGGVGKMAGLTDAAIEKLMTATVAATGAMSESNNFRREAESYLKPLVDAGKMTPEEMDRSLGIAEVFGAATGSTEAFTGISRMTKRIGAGSVGKSFLRQLFDVAGKDGAAGAAKWLRGPGAKAAVDVASEMLEESAQEFGQGAAENLYASLTFDKGREILPTASEGANSAAVSTLIVSAFTQALGLPKSTRRYKSLAEAINKGAEERGNNGKPPSSPGPSPTAPVTPGPKSGAGSAPNLGSGIETPSAQAPASPEEVAGTFEGQTVQNWEFTDKDGRKESVLGTGLKDALDKLPKDFKPDLKKTPTQTTVALPAVVGAKTKSASVANTPTYEEDLATATETNAEMAKRLPVGADGKVDRGPAMAARRRAAERIVATLKPGDKVGDFTVHGDNLKPGRVGGKSILKPGEAMVESGYGKDSHIVDLAGEVQGGENITRADTTPHAHPEHLEGEPIDKEWTAFSDESKSLGIPRDEMPQIKTEARGALTNFLRARGITHTEEEVLPGTLKPTQAEYSEAKVQKSIDRRIEENGQGRAIIVTADNHIVDGHHQWMAALKVAPNEPFKVIRLRTNIQTALGQIKEFPSVKAAAGAESISQSDKPATGQIAGANVPQSGQPAGEQIKPVQPQSGQSQRGDLKPNPQAAVAPAIPRGQNTAATLTKTLVKVSGEKQNSSTGKFLADFSARMSRINKEAFAGMEVHVLDDEQWKSHPGFQSGTPDSAGAYHPGTNTLFIHSARSKGKTIANTIVHEAGHFAEKYALGEGFTQGEWAKLTREQREEAAAAYDPAFKGANFDLIDNRQARAEWVAMQFTRVVRGETDGMGKALKAKLEKWLNEVRSLVDRWIGDGKLTTPQLDAKILEILGEPYTEVAPVAQAAPVVKESLTTEKPIEPKVAPQSGSKADQMMKDIFKDLLGTPSAAELERKAKGKTVELSATTPSGKSVSVQMDASEALKDTKSRLGIYDMLLNCLKS